MEFKRKPGKTILDLKILKKHNIQSKHLVYLLLTTILFLSDKKNFLFVVLTGISGIFSFYHDKHNRTPVDLKLPLVLGIFITYNYTLAHTFVFFIISDLIPGILGGGKIEGASLLFITWYFIVNAMVYIIPGDIIYVGIILVIIEAIGSTFIHGFFGMPGIVALLSSALSVLARIIYFLTIGEILKFIFRLVIGG